MKMLLLKMKLLLLVACVCFCVSKGDLVNFESRGALAWKRTLSTAWHNGRLLNETLSSLTSGDTLLIPNKTFYLMGGVTVSGLKNVVIQIDGTLEFSDNMEEWPREAIRSGDGKKASVLPCLEFDDIEGVTFTSSGKGLLEGNGAKWWGYPGIGYLQRGENRPRMLHLKRPRNVLVEHLIFKDPPYWTFLAEDVDGLEVRFSEIDARRLNQNMDDGHNIIDLTAFNTDGFDVTGKNVWMHDLDVWNQDDCIAVKDGSENMLFERIRASGLGLTIGSIGGSVVRNITFRDCSMHHTYKGIYLKFRKGGGGSISDVLFENIYMDAPQQWPIWIGPAQQSDSNNICAPNGGCSICWPTLPGSECDGIENSKYSNITLRNVTVDNPAKSPGVILAHPNTPMQGVVFEDVVVNNPATSPFKSYMCENVVSGVARGKTSPVPPCFDDQTDYRKQ